jgi:orotate phosphoribosyltransferase
MQVKYQPTSLEIERAKRIRVSLWAYAYEEKGHSIVSDVVFDQTCHEIDPSVDTGNPPLDHFFKTCFHPCTGCWIHEHPDLRGIELLYQRLFMNDQTPIDSATFSNRLRLQYDQRPLVMQHDKAKLLEFIKTNDVIQHGKFKLASGQESDIYIDAKKVTLQGKALQAASELLLAEMKKHVKFQAIGGPSAGADPLVAGMIIPDNLIGFMVRKEPKGHGTNQLIDGPVKPGMNVIIVEDTVTTGGSALKAIQAAKDFGLNVKGVGTIFFRGTKNPFDVPFTFLYDLSEFTLPSS